MTSSEHNNERFRRKLDHLRLYREGWGAQSNAFDEVYLVHQALPEFDLKDVDLSVRWLGKTLAAPFIINAMTGGTPASLEINRILARAAARTGVAMAVGSQHIALEAPKCRETFSIVRRENPGGVILANVSAAASLDEAFRAVEMIDADGLQLHLNVVQELLMPEGDRDFSHYRQRIREVASGLSVPVIVKEVGNGLSREAAVALYGCGVRRLDIGGGGGTNFAAIESRRAGRDKSLYSCWGLPTAISLIEVATSGLPLEITATGGIESPLEAAKALALGASLVGVAGYFLKVCLEEGEEGLVAEIERWKEDLRNFCLMCGARNIQELKDGPVIVTGRAREWLEARGIDPAPLARR
ncbi:MAG TPA: type 2 isopentenyl-diphosphate Delta-isomerase [Peptococcaceae bacterium]|nr:type 2 isopentenyl-diphosphate Delta-isomerase [Peptococcaceae bacterium]